MPVHFSAKSRRNVISAATEAGFNILQTITEPTAALIAYEIGFNADEPPSNVLVYRLGGLTTDITVFRVANGLYEQLDYTHLKFGGNRITKLLADYMCPNSVKQLKLQGTKERDTNIKIYYHADDCKRILSTMQSVQVYMENLVNYDDRCIDSNQTVTRARFENAFASELPAFIRPIEELLTKNDIQIDKVSQQSALPDFVPILSFFVGDTVRWLNENTKISIYPDVVVSQCTNSQYNPTG